MKKLCIHDIVDIVSEGGFVAVVGLGCNGRKLVDTLQKSDLTNFTIFDNNPEIQRNGYNGMNVYSPEKITDKTCLYIIATSASYQAELKKQLNSLEINTDDIAYLHLDMYDVRSTMPEECYKDEISKMFYKKHGYELNWKNPVTYSEKINVDKIYAHDPLKTLVSDKYSVRDWVKEQIGEKYLTKLYGVWDDARKIDFDELPEKFALKVNNASSRNFIVNNKADIDRECIVKTLNSWLRRNYFFEGFEWQYKDIVPRIICEEYLEGVADSVYDYQFYCFHGEPKYIWCVKHSHRENARASFYSTSWDLLPFSYGYPKDLEPAPCPSKLEDMLVLSQKLSANFKYVRVDLYNLPTGRVLFGEITISPWNGMMKFDPVEYDKIFGDLI